MTVTFIANYFNHHQLPLSIELQRLTDGGYTYIAATPISKERLELGYADMNNLPFILRTYESEEEYQRCIDRIKNDDMVIFGSCPDELIDLRSNTGKPYIVYSERFFKKGTYRRFIPITYRKIYNRLLKHEGENVKIICSSAYLPYDLKLLKKTFDTYKWGYFPETKLYDPDSLMEMKKGNKIRLLWVARLIPLKHPEDAIAVAEKLHKDNIDFTLDIIGSGPMSGKLQKMIEKKGLTGCVRLLGSVPADEVRYHMERANIFMFTSDFHEGWGAVMNEAMNSGCAVVASHAAGSVPFLVSDGVNGRVYESGNVNDLYVKVKELCCDSELCERMGKAGYQTITETWAAKNAAEHLYSLIEAMVNGGDAPIYDDGPCSIAPVIYPKYKRDQNDKK